ncbi:hypothetical protein [Candidatus Harpocratesius sp.]
MAILCYSWIRGVSIHHACKKLNLWSYKFLDFKPQKYSDGRFSRAFPHQTTINDWLRKPTLLKIEENYQIIFEKMIRRIFLSNSIFNF